MSKKRREAIELVTSMQVELATMLRGLQEEERDEARRSELVSLPPEPCVGSIVRFALTYKSSGSSYNFAAINANGRWFTTGSTCPVRGYSWKEFIAWLRRGDVARVNGMIVMTRDSSAAPIPVTR